MWPMFVDYSDEDCRRALRTLELEAYASIVNAFRAQGCLTKERKKMLQELCSALSISIERHRAEVRRAVNDEHLNTIAERLFGPNTSTEWAIEGRRLVPLMPRLAPQTAFTAIANSAANAQAAKNATLPLPGKTGSREMTNGIETMASRKRKEFPSDSVPSPQKISAVDNQCVGSLRPFENASTPLPEQSQTPTVPVTSESSTPPDPVLPVPSACDITPTKTVSSSVTSHTTAVSPAKSISKHVMVKSTSTVTTFSSFDQLSTNLLTSRTISQSSVPITTQEEQVTPVSEPIKTTCEVKTSPRLSPSISSMKSSIMSTPATCTSLSSPIDRPPVTSSTASQSNKFLTQIRPKNQSHGRQSLSSSLGLKLNTQPQMTQRAISPKSNLKVKQDSLSFFTKKPTTVFSSSSHDSQSSQFTLPSVSDSLSITKSPASVTKPSAKSDSPPVSTSQTSTKLTTVTKSFQKTSTHGSQYMARSLFSSSTKTGAKSLPPVIYNVSSTTCTPLQTSTKTTVPMQSEASKTTPQLLPKSTTVGIGHSHLKLSTSNTQTIQYRNDGGMVRSARIVNISQPVGSRLPCAISPSAISALGLASNLTSTALRVTLPAGTLNTSSSMRVSAAAKPNVIVVHKAQMWSKTQGAAVIMSSAATLPKLSNDVVESVSVGQKQEKSRLCGAKLAPRLIAPARPHSPAVSSSTLKIAESSLLSNPFSTKTSQPESLPPDNANLKSENLSETQCKKNLLADIIEASGILEGNSPDKASLKDKSEESNDDKELSNFQELDTKKLQKNTIGSTTNDSASLSSSELSISKKGSSINTSETSALLTSEVEKKRSEIKQTTVEKSNVHTGEPLNVTVPSSHGVSENLTVNSSDHEQKQVDVTKEKKL